MDATEGTDEVRAPNTPASHFQGGVLVNIRSSKVASIANLKKRIYERNGMIAVAEGRNGKAKHPCSCNAPCGFRYFPGVSILKNLQMSDVEAMMRRVYTQEYFDEFKAELERRRAEKARWEASSVLKRRDGMRLGIVPGAVLRGLCHDFPEDFATSMGVPVKDQHEALEKALNVFFAFRCFRPAGMTA